MEQGDNPAADVALTSSVSMPQVGFGVYKVPPEETAGVVCEALKAGYRAVDTATLYHNEAGVGEALRNSGLPREDVFVTTKLWNSDHGYDAALRAFDRSLGELGMDYVDLYLIHWPMPGRDEYVDTWRALERLYADGRARAIGVSNFNVSHLRRVLDTCEVPPAVNQIELHPYLPQTELRTFHAEQGIVTQAWSPLARGAVFLERAVTALASKYRRTSAQIVLRWHIELGNLVIPKSVTPARIAENLDVFGFELTAEEVRSLSELENGKRIGPDPDLFERV